MNHDKYVRRGPPQRRHAPVRVTRVGSETRKRCTGPCALPLPLSAFSRDPQGPLGLCRECRWCRRERRAGVAARKRRVAS